MEQRKQPGHQVRPSAVMNGPLQKKPVTQANLFDEIWFLDDMCVEMFLASMLKKRLKKITFRYLDCKIRILPLFALLSCCLKQHIWTSSLHKVWKSENIRQSLVHGCYSSESRLYLNIVSVSRKPKTHTHTKKSVKVKIKHEMQARKMGNE